MAAQMQLPDRSVGFDGEAGGAVTVWDLTSLGEADDKPTWKRVWYSLGSEWGFRADRPQAKPREKDNDSAHE
jgi:hypothetical protein